VNGGRLTEGIAAAGCRGSPLPRRLSAAKTWLAT